jgi:pyrimidine and pyridine-specific 5'-nucleotidase
MICLTSLQGLIYCDYADPNFSCKPEEEYYNDALAKANVTDPLKCYFIDDSKINVDAAKRLGWGHCVHFCERGLVAVEGGRAKEIGTEYNSPSQDAVTTLEELRTVWKELFK